MKYPTFVRLTALLLSTTLAAQEAATPPGLLPFEARVVDTSGQPLNASGIPARFAFYPTETGGMPLVEELRIVDIVDGHLSAQIGFENDPGFQALFEQHADLYLGITLDQDSEMVPRLRIGSSPFALRAASSSRADDVTGDIHPASVSVAGQVVIDELGQWVGDTAGFGGGWTTTSSGSTIATWVGIGAEDPLAALHVQQGSSTIDASVAQGNELIVEAGDASMGLYSNQSGSWGSCIQLGETVQNTLVDKWSLIRNTPAQGSKLHVTFGDDAESHENPSIMTFAPDGNVGIGTTFPLRKLAVAGDASFADELHVSGGGSSAALMLATPEDSFLRLKDSRDALTIQLRADEDNAGEISLYTGNENGSSTRTIEIDGDDASGGGGVINVRNENGERTLELDGDHGDAGAVYINNAAGNRRVTIVANSASGGGALAQLENDSGDTTVSLDADVDGSGVFELRTADQVGTVELVAAESSGDGGQLKLRNGAGELTVELDGDRFGAAELRLSDAEGNQRVVLEADSNGKGRVITDLLEMRNENGERTLELDGDHGEAGAVYVNSAAGNRRVTILASSAYGGGALALLENNSGDTTVSLDADVDGSGALELQTADQVGTVELVAAESPGDGGQLKLRNGAGELTVELDGDRYGAAELRLSDAAGDHRVVLEADNNGKGRVTTDVLEIRGGADIVEGFDMTAQCEPGTVVVIDAAKPGHLLSSSSPYDTKVAGVVSGAGGVDPGLRLGQAGILDGDTPVALTGRVWVKCSTENGPIRPGDRLTTSGSSGHAMRATDVDRAPGAVIGKAMSSLDEERGLVLVLVNLQ